MTIALRTACAFVALSAAPALAGLPAPERSGCFPNQNPCPGRCELVVTGQAGCQFRFRPDGGLDRLTAHVTLRDAFDNPTVSCSTSVYIVPDPGTLALCGCCPLVQTGFSDAAGALRFVFPSIGGRGTLRVAVTAHCGGNIGLFDEPVDFTSTDLDGTCEAVDASTVIDLALWAHCLPPSAPCRTSDYSCDGTVNVIDLAVWAGGLGVGCGAATCP